MKRFDSQPSKIDTAGIIQENMETGAWYEKIWTRKNFEFEHILHKVIGQKNTIFICIVRRKI